MGRDIISDDHRHVVKEKHKPSLIQILKLWFFTVAIFDFLKRLTQDHSQTVSSKFFSRCISLSTPQTVDTAFSQPVSQSLHQLT